MARSPRSSPTKTAALGSRPYQSFAPRAARVTGRAPPPIELPQGNAPLTIATRRDLAASQKEIAARINADPRFAVMVLVNPVLAFKDLGIELSAEVQHHLMHRTQHPVELRKRRDALEQALREALGEEPRPNDRAWLAATVFERLKLAPVDSAGIEPAYLPPLNTALIARLAALRPKPKPRYRGARRASVKAGIRVAAWQPAARRLDLDAELPKLPALAQAPRELALDALYFYKDAHPLARQLLELGIIQRQGFPFHTPDAYRKIRAGERRNAFRNWIRSVRFPVAES
ncbi:MAG: hypothetical protein IT531_16185 [Burkholderiales bacterium]|nr:hypothetical protein [Burkholderiales bacterium]